MNTANHRHRATEPALTTGEIGSVVLGTAGHVDHGKTALVCALTGTNTDRLPEEKSRGITIDLGFAALNLTVPTGQRFQVSFIDVPGHHAFLHNMLAGAGGIDGVLLVVAADEGVKAQTIEHLQICRLLGIERGLVILTKRDAVTPERLEAARAEAAQLIHGSFLQDAPILTVSALRGEGIASLRSALTHLVAAVPPRTRDRVARLPIDRAFSVRGFGTVVTGTLQAGAVQAGQSLILEPGRRTVRVRGLQVHGEARQTVAAPNRVALNLSGVQIAELHRGDTLIAPYTLEPVTLIDAALELLPGMTLRHRSRVRIYAFAAESLATVLLYDLLPETLTNLGIPKNLLARFRLSPPLVLVPGDHFVLRQLSPPATLGGGRVLDGHPMPRQRKAAVLTWLRTLQRELPARELYLRIERRGTAGIRWDQLVAEVGWTHHAINRSLQPALESRTVITAGEHEIITAEALAEVEARLLQPITATPNGTITQSELRGKAHLTEAIFTLAVSRLQASRRLHASGDTLSLPEVARTTPQTGVLTGLTAQVEALYRAAALTPPLTSEAAERLHVAPAALRSAIINLLRAGKLVRLGSDALLIHIEALERLGRALQSHRGERFDVIRFKSFTGLTRKHAIPILEYLDGARLTRNTGGTRIVN